ncbi:heterokaryon incompatibility protein-domain-containing protein [Pseudoneurospora amorphoporcata]|uniref:Heterokaryon incompatibility protein-domain-containing protein n=1 Tax=Pseudoneurospora amorphoporcata TaxID=241081 RepID=A0AAN6NX51_9PEZI|nr:heterokaryon incompatibility protein-domain-containing protein [Pseudoneurospora amorphoporcata]
MGHVHPYIQLPSNVTPSSPSAPIASTSAPRFNYNTSASLPDPNTTIRLLEICPSYNHSDTEDLYCTLYTTSVISSSSSSPPPPPPPPLYTALSYAWGEGTKSRRIRIIPQSQFQTLKENHHDPDKGQISQDLYENAPFLSITPTLDTCLRTLCRFNCRWGQTHPPALWIDQICINQDDDQEKGFQVQLMREIYSLADKVLVWLGPDADACDEVMQGLAVMGYLTMHSGVLGGPPVNWVPNPDEALFDKLATPEVKELLRKVIPVFVPLAVSGKLEAWLKRSWFSRVWVIQEFCLNKHVLVACGRTMTFGELLCLAQELFLLFDRIRANVYALPMREEIAESLALLQSVPAERMPVRLGHLFGMRLWQRQGRRTPLRNLLERMFTSASTAADRVVPQATKYRDRIYGLLGLANDAEHLDIRPDYRRSTSTAEVLTQVARAIIQKESQLHVLRFAQFPKTNVDDDDGVDSVQLASLPSWVPDWANDTECSLALETDYSACGKFLTAEIMPTSNPAVLGLRGVVVDKVEDLGQPWPSSTNRTPDLIVKYSESLMRLWNISSDKGGDIYPTSSRLDEAFWRLAVGDRRYHGQSGEWAPWKPFSAFVSRKPATSTTLSAFQELLEFCRVNILLNGDEEQDGGGDLSPELRQFVKDRGIMLHDIPGSSIPDSGRVLIASSRSEVAAQNLNHQQAVTASESPSSSSNTEIIPSSRETPDPTTSSPSHPPANHIQVILADPNKPPSHYRDPQNPQSSNTIAGWVAKGRS